MKTRKHRIFIINKNNNNILQANHQVGPKDETNDGERNTSKRKRLFTAIEEPRQSLHNAKSPQYTYQIKPHIHAQSLASLIQCDFLASNQQQKSQLQNRNTQTALIADNPGNQEPVSKKQNLRQALVPNEQLSNQSFTGKVRKRLFDNLNLEQFKSRNFLSSLSCANPTRKNIFFRYSSPNDLSLNSSKQRRRIFSFRGNVLSNLAQHPDNKPNVLPSTIKEQQQREASRITQGVGQSKKEAQRLHRQY